MQRAIAGFHQDASHDWVAELSCGHDQHVRHQPPFTQRPWASTEEGRASKIGALLDCVRCDRFEIPEGFVATRRTGDMTESTVPAGLLRDHVTKPGTWARIVVLEGTLRYVVESLGHSELLSPSTPGAVAPEVPHHIEPMGAARFYVEFMRAPDRASVDR